VPTPDPRYQTAGPVLVRASTYPTRRDRLALPNPTATAEQRRAWLAQAWTFPGLRAAVTLASGDLAGRIDQLLTADTQAPTEATRRAVAALSSYVARWQRRCTPFGLFAGVATVTVGPAAARFGEQHRVVVRADADWLARVVEELERDRGLRRRLLVVADNGAVIRGGRVFVARRGLPGQAGPGPARETSTRHTRPVAAALARAACPVRFDRLAELLSVELGAAAGTVETLLHDLIDGQLLVTNLRAPATAVDGLAHVTAVLREAEAARPPAVTALLDALEQVQTLIDQHNRTSDPQIQERIRDAAVGCMTRLAAPGGYPLAADARLDADVSLPAAVVDEARRAADLLLRVGTAPFGSAAWMDYHLRFRDRYGPGALVAVRELVADSGLGYPHGYLGAPGGRPAWRAITERDVHLLALVQRALLDGAEEIGLTDADIDALTVGDHPTAVAPARIELGVTVHARDTAALDRGEFELRIVGAPRAHTSMVGRFAYLLDAADHHTLLNGYRGAGNDAVAVQLSFPPRRVHNENVARVGQLLPDVVALSEHPTGKAISLDDLAVTGDADQLYLVRRSTGQRVIPQIPHALDTTVQTPPLARFLAEVAGARSAVFGPFDLGAAVRTLPYVPRIRCGRTVLSAARWLLTAADLQPPAGPAGARGAADAGLDGQAADGRDDASRDHTSRDHASRDDVDWHERDSGEGGWDQVVGRWRQRWCVPARVIVCHGELRLPLDLDQPADRAILRARLRRAERLEIREDGPAGGDGWLGRPAEFVVPMTLTAAPARRLPHAAPAGRVHRPGTSAVVHAQLAGHAARFDDVLLQLPALMGALADHGVARWWIRRRRDPIRPDADQHLAVLVRLREPAAFPVIAARLGGFADDLHDQGLPADLSFVAYCEHPARYGTGPAGDAAEEVFAADTVAAIAQLRTAAAAGVPAQALAAASMARLAGSFGRQPRAGYEQLLACLDRHSGPIDRSLSDLARDLADPTDGFGRLRRLPGGTDTTDAWTVRDAALRAYRDRLAPQRDPAGVLRTLLHEHHVRAVGAGPEFERRTGQLARAAAMRCLALTGPA
jgi:lantibiotic biosynthesis protein